MGKYLTNFPIGIFGISTGKRIPNFTISNNSARISENLFYWIGLFLGITVFPIYNVDKFPPARDFQQPKN